MKTNSGCEIFSSRILPWPVETVFGAFANPEQLKKWWGPEGFTNTIHEFDLRPGGRWILTMHGPEKGNYENSSVFKIISPLRLITWERISQPLFDMEVGFKRVSDTATQISFRMIFKTPGECRKIEGFAIPKNEENFDRLQRELSTASKK